jgi:hypothetical protein
MKILDKIADIELSIMWLFAPLVIIAIIASLFGYTPPKKDPIKLPTVQEVGKKTGEVGTDFSIGIAKGVWKKLKESVK